MSRHADERAPVARTIAFIRSNRDRIVVDLTILFTWIVASTALFRWLSTHQWLYYLVVFSGVTLYSRLTPAWEQPQRHES